ncbi:MAG TPA: penicillin-binding protein 2, partial [bacterium]|nr:penicillin-binding protein 2 [bacterium]
EHSLKNLSQVAEVPYATLRQEVLAKRNTGRFKPVMLLKDTGRKVADLVDAYQEDLPGISVTVEAKRLYPNAELASHVLGYVGVINEDQLESLSTRQLYSARVVGQAGIERVANRSLIGVDGGKQVEVDHLGRELRDLSKQVDPIPGHDVYLTIDLRLQRKVHQLLGNYHGAVIVMKPHTGEVLSLVSLPDFDPNSFVGGISQDEWTRLTQGEFKPLVDKAVQGLYPPGSTFKMLVAAAALDSGAIDDKTVFHCPGYYRIGRDVRYCWKHSGHGDMTVRQAIEQSCDVFFYNVGLLLGPDKIRDYGAEFGFTQATGVELEDEKSGLLPTRAWKQRMFKDKWYDGETLPVSIGQGYVSVTPLQLLNYVNVIANRGVWVQPTIVEKIVDANGQVTESPKDLPRASRLLPIAPQVFDTLVQGMVDVVNSGRGTGGAARSRFFTVAGKTGTSQVVSRKTGKPLTTEDQKDLQPHSLFVGFAPAEDPQVSVLVLVEHGQHGGSTAAPIARQILEFYSENVEPLDKPVPSNKSGPGDQFRDRLQQAFGPDRAE